MPFILHEPQFGQNLYFLVKLFPQVGQYATAYSSIFRASLGADDLVEVKVLGAKPVFLEEFNP